jgi:hypothetical protein
MKTMPLDLESDDIFIVWEYIRLMTYLVFFQWLACKNTIYALLIAYLIPHPYAYLIFLQIDKSLHGPRSRPYMSL